MAGKNTFKHRKRRIRRQNKQSLKHGQKAKPTHRLKGGRTGSVHAKNQKSKKLPEHVQGVRVA